MIVIDWLCLAFIRGPKTYRLLFEQAAQKE